MSTKGLGEALLVSGLAVLVFILWLSCADGCIWTR